MQHRFARSLAAITAVILTALPAAHAATWTIDPTHSEVGFKVRHMMISNVRGTFSDVKGTVIYDPAHPTQASVDVTIQAASIDTGVSDRDDHLRGPDFFDVKKHPTITFRSKSVEKAGPNKLRVRGDLTLLGVTREVVLNVDGPSSPVTDPWGNVRVGASATAEIDRTDFGMKWNKTLDTGGVVVGEKVQIQLEIELVKQSD